MAVSVRYSLTGQRGEPLALGVTVFEVLQANYVRAPKVYRRGRPAALKALAKVIPPLLAVARSGAKRPSPTSSLV
ncbi:hypothetical protein [Xanthomonas cassavae]|uniref:hypothetical protein n=1 Tax=Xanthomonas cassavae TaxID=56450 RepID=UPI00053A8B76